MALVQTKSDCYIQACYTQLTCHSPVFSLRRLKKSVKMKLKLTAERKDYQMVR